MEKRIIMEKRTEIGCNDRHRNSFFMNQLHISSKTIRLIPHIGIGRIFCQNTLKANRRILNTVSERSTDFISYHITAINQFCYLPFVCTVFSQRLNVVIKIGTNNLMDIVQPLEKSKLFYNKIVSKDSFIWKATFSRLVYLAIVDLKNGLFKIPRLVGNMFNIDVVFFTLLKFMYLLPYKPWNLQSYTLPELYRQKEISRARAAGKIFGLFSKTNQKFFLTVGQFTLLLLSVVIYQKNNSCYFNQNVSHVINIMHAHVNNLSLDDIKHYNDPIVDNQSRLLNSYVDNINCYTLIQNHPRRFNNKLTSNTTKDWILNANILNMAFSHIQYPNKLVTENQYLKILFIETQFNFTRKIVKNIQGFMLNILNEEYKSKRLITHAVSSNSVNILHKKQLLIYRFCDKKFKNLLQQLSIMFATVNRQTISQVLDFETKIWKNQLIDSKLIRIIHFLDLTHQSFRYKVEQLKPSYNDYDHMWKINTWIASVKSIQNNLNQFTNSVTKFDHNILQKLNKRPEKINTGYNNLFFVNNFINKCDTNYLLNFKTVTNDLSNFKNVTQHFFTSLSHKRLHYLLNSLVSQKQTNAKSIYRVSKVIDLSLYEQIPLQIKSVKELINWFDNCVAIPSIELKLNQKTLDLIKLLNLQQDLLLNRTNDEDDLLNSTNDEDSLLNSTNDEDLLLNSTNDEDDLLKSTNDEDSLLNSINDEDSLLNSINDEDLLLNNTNDEDLLLNNTNDEDYLLNSTNDEDYLLNNTNDEDYLLNSTNDEDSLLNNTNDEDSLLNSTNDEDSLLNSTNDVSLFIPNSKTICNLINQSVKIETNLFYINNGLTLNQVLYDEDFGNDKLSLVNSKYDPFSKLHQLLVSHKLNLFQNYKGWILTSEWWLLLTKTLAITIPFISQNIYDWIQSLSLSILRKLFISKTNLFVDFVEKSKDLFVDFVKKIIVSNPFLLQIGFEKLKNWKQKVISPIWIHNFSFNIFETAVLLGWTSICFYRLIEGYFDWKQFDISRNFTNFPTKQQFPMLDYCRRERRLTKKKRLLSNFDQQTLPSLDQMFINIKFKIPRIEDLLNNFFHKKMKKFWSFISTIDFLKERIKDKIVLAFMLNNVKTTKRLEFHTETANGLDFKISEQLSNTYAFYSNQFQNKVNYLHNLKNIYFADYSLNDLCPANPKIWLHKVEIEQNFLSFNFGYQGLFLIGPPESGKSTLIKNLVNIANKPLIQVKIDDFIYRYQDPQRMTKSIDMLSSAFTLIRVLGSCIVWLSDLDHFYKNYQSDVRSWIIYSFFKTMQKQLSEDAKKTTHFIATSNNIKTTDPQVLFSPIFDHLISLQTPNKLQRQTSFFNLLYTHNFNLTDKFLLKKITDKTVRYTWNDLKGLFNEIRLIGKTQNTSVLENSMAKLALHRQKCRTTLVSTSLQKEPHSFPLPIISNQMFYKSTWFIQETIHYKIGQAIIQHCFKHSNSVLSLDLHSNIWKRDFYYLATGYLEVPFYNSTITESIVFSYILMCLGGSAARDAWIVCKDNITENRLVVNFEIEQNHKLALRLFQSLFTELVSRDTYNERCYKHDLLPKFGLTHYPFSLNFSNYIKFQTQDTNSNNLLNKDTLFSEASLELEQKKFTHIMRTIPLSNRMKRLDVSSKPRFDIVDRKPNVFLDKNNTQEGGPSFRMTKIVGTKPKTLYNKYVMSKEQRLKSSLYSRYSKSIPLMTTHFMECHPYKDSSAVFIGAEIALDEKDLLYCLCTLSCYKNLVITQNVLTMFYFSYTAIAHFVPYRKRLFGQDIVSWIKQYFLDEITKKYRSDTTGVKPTTLKKTLPLKWFELVLNTNVRFKNCALYESITFDELCQNAISVTCLPNSHIKYPQKPFRKQRKIVSQEECLYGTFLESYHYLFNVYLLCNAQCTQLKSHLIKKGVLFFQDI